MIDKQSKQLFYHQSPCFTNQQSRGTQTKLNPNSPLAESTESGDGGVGPVSWRLTLDQDLIETLKSSFPTWFPGSNVGSGGNNQVPTVSPGPPSPTGSSISNCGGEKSLEGIASSIDCLALRLSTSPNNSSSGVSSNESGSGTPAISFRSSSISSTNSFPPSPPSLVIYATQIEQPPGQRAAFKQILADMAEGGCLCLSYLLCPITNGLTLFPFRRSHE